MLKQNRTQLGNEPFDATHAGKNIPSVRSSMEDILSDENNKNNYLLE
jgi:hypothetical protein